MPGSHLFNLGLYQKNFLPTSRVTGPAINMGCTRGRGSTTRMFNYCTQHSPTPSLCINNFITLNNPNNNKCNLNYISYYNTVNSDISGGVSTWQGMCSYKNNQIVLCGTTLPNTVMGIGLVYIGNIECNDPNQSSYTFLVPGSTYTSCYGPRYDVDTDEFTLVGSYLDNNDKITYGFLFKGTLNKLQDPLHYVTKMKLPGEFYQSSYLHSIDGNFAVGSSGFLDNPTLNAFIYNITTGKYTQYKFKNSEYTTLYGIIQNLNGTYTIVGGYADSLSLKSQAFIADMIYNEETDELTFQNQTSLTYYTKYVNHYEGISSTDNPNIYTVAGISIGLNNSNTGISSILMRDTNSGTFKILKTTEIDYSCSIGIQGTQTANSVLNNYVVGYFVSKNNFQSYQCIIDWNKVSYNLS